MKNRMLRVIFANFALLVGAFSTGCEQGRDTAQAICILIDVSGTYVDEAENVVKVIKREVIPNMVPGDTLITILIDSASYEKENLETLATLDARPSRANAQKLALARRLDDFAARENQRSRFTDIPGAMMLGAEYLQESESGSRVMLIFSDLQEELPDGVRRRMRDDELTDIQLVALNVKRLDHDAVNPEVFRARLAGWESRVTAAGGTSWRMLMDASKLPGLLADMRS